MLNLETLWCNFMNFRRFICETCNKCIESVRAAINPAINIGAAQIRFPKST